MDIWSDKDEAFFKVPWQNPMCLNSSSVFFSIETSAKLTAKRMQNASSIAISSSLFSLHKPLCDPLMSFSRRYPVCTQALPWWLPGHNGNDVFSSFGASNKKNALENLPKTSGVGRDSDVLFGESWWTQIFSPEKTDVENRWDILLFWLHNPHEKMKETTYLNWLDSVY